MNSVVIQTQSNGTTTVTFRARNTFVSIFVTCIGGLPAFACFLLAFVGIQQSAFGTALGFAALGCGLIAITWFLGWRKKPFEIVFSKTGLQTAMHSFPYDAITDIVLNSNGGAAFDPASTPVPRNTAPGVQVAVMTGATATPITVCLPRVLAVQVRDACVQLLSAQRAENQ